MSAVTSAYPPVPPSVPVPPASSSSSFLQSRLYFLLQSNFHLSTPIQSRDDYISALFAHHSLLDVATRLSPHFTSEPSASTRCYLLEFFHHIVTRIDPSTAATAVNSSSSAPAPPPPADSDSFLSHLESNLYKWVCSILPPPQSSATTEAQENEIIQISQRVCKTLARWQSLTIVKKKHSIQNALKYAENAREMAKRRKKGLEDAATAGNNGELEYNANGAMGMGGMNHQNPGASSAPGAGPVSSAAASLLLEANRLLENLRSSQKRRAIEANLRPLGETREEELKWMWNEELKYPFERERDKYNPQQLMRIWHANRAKIWKMEEFKEAKED